MADAVSRPVRADPFRSLDGPGELGGLHDDLPLDPLLHGRKRRLIFRDALLVPERDRRAEIRAVFEVVKLALARSGIEDLAEASPFDLRLERLPEGDGGLDVPAVRREPAVLPVGLLDRHSGIRVGEEAEVPGVGEVILRAGPHDRRLLLAVYVEAVVRFSEPASETRLDREDRAHVVPLSAPFEEDVGRERLRRELLAVARVEIERARGEPGELHPVDLKVDREASAPLVLELDPRERMKRHAPVAVESASVRGDLDGKRVHIGAHAVSRGEEIADRRLDARDLGAVPIDPEDERPRIPPVLARDRKPDVPDFARTLELGQCGALPRREVPGVPVRLGIEKPARGSARFPFNLPRDLGEGVAGERSGGEPRDESRGQDATFLRACAKHGLRFPS